MEFYTCCFYNANQIRRRNQRTSTVVVANKQFNYMFFRPNEDGPDILVNQVVESDRTFEYSLHIPVIQSKGALHQFILGSASAQHDQYATYLRFCCCLIVFNKKCILTGLWMEGEQHFRTSSSCHVCTHGI